jgi:AraC-like DNA-binding protein
MAPVRRLLTTVQELQVLDGYQYIAGSRQPVALPSDIRLILRHRPAAELGNAIHDQYSLVVALEQPGQVRLDQHQVRLAPGEALLIQPGQVHGYANLTPEPVTWLFCGFHLSAEGGWADLRSTPVRLSERMVDDFVGLLQDHFFDLKHGKRHTPHSERQVALRLLLVLEQMLAARAASATAITGEADAANPFVQRVVAHVGDHLAEPLSIASVARALHLSPGHLRNEFHRLAGVGIGRYIRTARIRHACILLDTTDLPLHEIGRRCGYESLFSFSRAFKGDKGIPPTAYRQSLAAVR